MRHQLASVHELMRAPALAGLPGETLARLAERMERRDLDPGETVDAAGRFAVVLTGMLSGSDGVLRPGDVVEGSARALTPAAVASCARADYDAVVG